MVTVTLPHNPSQRFLISSANRKDNKHMYVSHAELNAVLNKNSSTVEGCRIYVALFPCNECAKIIIQSGIKEVGQFLGNLCTRQGPDSVLFW